MLILSIKNDVFCLIWSFYVIKLSGTCDAMLSLLIKLSFNAHSKIFVVTCSLLLCFQIVVSEIVVLLIVKWCFEIVWFRLRIFATSLCLLFKKDFVSRLNIYMLTKSNRFHFANKSFFETQSWFTSSLNYCFLIDVVSSKI